MSDVASGASPGSPGQPETCAKCGKNKKGSDEKPETVSRVVEEGQPKYQLKSGEEGLSVFANMSDQEVMDSANWRDGSSIDKKSVADLEDKGLTVEQTHGDCDFLDDKGQDNHFEIRPGQGMTRNEFKKIIKEL